MASKPDLVTFNVSGKIYQVLWEPTLSLHPNSLLTQLAEDKQDDKEIFVEGDQDLFKYVLEYHRDRKILLPQHVSMAAVQRELMRFGLDVSPREWGALDKACACQTLLGSCMLGCASHRTWRTYWIWQRLLPASRRPLLCTNYKVFLFRQPLRCYSKLLDTVDYICLLGYELKRRGPKLMVGPGW
ncbi:unnamed protein product [Durusdinium trenchii]|uniref:Potassium channel tetramerisation-type BTB domain-containing protein n=1 Tax=Durusdinium trenchii TaxID=1381693 RepID=A0ABP0NHM6_9DINO